MPLRLPSALLAALPASVTLLLVSQLTWAVTFNDVASSKGLTHTGTTYGGAWSKDANGDGKPDLWLGNHSTGADPILYLSTPSGFSPSSALTGLVSADFHGSAWADFNNDGHQDLLVMAGGGAGVGAEPNQLFVGNGSSWTEQGAALNIDNPLGRARQATWLDWNNDGFLDVALINKNDRPEPPFADSQIFSWSPGAQTFVEESFTLHTEENQSFAQLLISNPALGGNTPALVTWARANNAGPDLALGYGPAGLTNVNAAFGLPAMSSLNDVATGDFNNDGAQDLIMVSNSAEVLLLQTGSGFTNATNGAGINTNNAAFIIAADFDNDMLLDLYIARSSLGSDTNKSNVLFLNQGNGVFAAVSGAGGASGTLQGLASGASAVDYNNDGWMDVFTTNSDNWFAPASATNGAPMQLFENTTKNTAATPNKWLKIVLQGTTSNRDGIGAAVTVVAGGVTQLREMNGGIHHRTQDDPRLHFGLGSNNQANTVTVTWPSGVVQQLNNVASNQILTVTEQSSGNQSPTAQFSTSAGGGPLDVNFNGSASSDPDGTLTNWAWNFGDGATASGATQSHSYTAAGSYTVALTVTDNDQATHTFTASVEVTDGTGGGTATKATTTVEAVGAKANLQSRLNDELTNNAQNLATFWRNDNTLATAWFTLDLGSAQSIAQVRIAPREKKQHLLEFNIGNNLNNGEVSGGSVRNCNKPKLGSAIEPSSLFTCALVTPAVGRYLSIRSTNRTNFRTYGVEVWVDAAGGGNAPPTAAFTATTTVLQVDLDASASSDSDGSITNWDWDFGDGDSASGEFTSHTYAASGTYTVTLTVTDNDDDFTSSAQSVQPNDGSGGGKLPLAVEQVSARASTAFRLIDEAGSGAQILSSRWSNGGGSSSSWITLDMGAGAAPNELRIAPRGDRDHNYDVSVGNSLSGGKVGGAVTDTCQVPITNGNSEPDVLSPCSLSGASGRYITIENPNSAYERIYGVELYQ